MKAIPYVSFNGNCEEAVQFYHSVLGGEVSILRFKNLPPEAAIPISDEWKEKVMHSAITFSDGNVMYFSDTWEDAPVTVGTNTTIHLQVDSELEVRTAVEKLSKGGEITMPAEKTFWGSFYGSFVDKFGVNWGIEYLIDAGFH